MNFLFLAAECPLQMNWDIIVSYTLLSCSSPQWLSELHKSRSKLSTDCDLDCKCLSDSVYNLEHEYIEHNIPLWQTSCGKEGKYVASFPGCSHLQYLITYGLHIQRFSKFLQHPVARARTVPSNQIAEGFEFCSLIDSHGWRCCNRKLQELGKPLYAPSLFGGLDSGLDSGTGLWDCMDSQLQIRKVALIISGDWNNTGSIQIPLTEYASF